MLNLDWKNLSFSYVRTNSNVRCYCTNGVWGDLEVHTEETVNMHIAATCLHYGQECFEGLKAYRGRDGKIRVFRWEENANRLNRSAERIMMQQVPLDIFKEAMMLAIKNNEEFVPPFETGASLYIRPLLIGLSPRIGLSIATDYLFMILVTPVGPYFKGGFKPVEVVVERGSDRAAPLGTGDVKIGGNYAASMRALVKAHHDGYSTVLYLDPKEKRYIDECGPANFFAVKNNTYITPASTSVLPSITNLSLMQLAKDMGMKVEKRQVPFLELETFEEAGQCGTAAVISPIGKIHDTENNKVYSFVKEDNQPGEKCVALYNRLVGIQYGEIADTHGWITIVE